MHLVCASSSSSSSSFSSTSTFFFFFSFGRLTGLGTEEKHAAETLPRTSELEATSNEQKKRSCCGKTKKKEKGKMEMINPPAELEM